MSQHPLVILVYSTHWGQKLLSRWLWTWSTGVYYEYRTVEVILEDLVSSKWYMWHHLFFNDDSLRVMIIYIYMIALIPFHRILKEKNPLDAVHGVYSVVKWGGWGCQTLFFRTIRGSVEMAWTIIFQGRLFSSSIYPVHCYTIIVFLLYTYWTDLYIYT